MYSILSTFMLFLYLALPSQALAANITITSSDGENSNRPEVDYLKKTTILLDGLTRIVDEQYGKIIYVYTTTTTKADKTSEKSVVMQVVDKD